MHIVAHHRMRTEAAEQAAATGRGRGKGRGGRQQINPDVVAAIEEMAANPDDTVLADLFAEDAAPPADVPPTQADPPPTQADPTGPPQLQRASTQASPTHHRVAVVACGPSMFAVLPLLHVHHSCN